MYSGFFVSVLLFLASACLSAASREPFAAVLQTTITNPAPDNSDAFGAAFAFVRNDRVVIGAPGPSANGGAAYLFNLDGTFLTNVAPYGAFHFGWSLASLPRAIRPDYDEVYVGAEYGYDFLSNNGVLYSFGVSTNGEYSVPQFWSPALWNPDYYRDPQDKFSASVATFGSERLIIGAPASGDLDYPPAGGAVFLYDVYHRYNPLTIITNPFPNPSAIGFPSIPVLFGWSVAAIGNDGILIGAPGSADGNGSVYLYGTNGSMLTSFTNHSAATEFGYSVAALGPDRIIIGAPSDVFGCDQRGLAFMYSTNGTLLTTFSNPVSTNSTARGFGGSVAAVGSDRVLVGASRGRTNTGAAFLFSTNGTLLATLINPAGAGATNDSFGATVTSVGSDRVLIGDTTSPYGGAAYLFRLAPTVEMERTSTNTLVISWSALAPDYALQQLTNGINSTDWSTVTEPVENDGTYNYIITSPLSPERYYRLVKP